MTYQMNGDVVKSLGLLLSFGILGYGVFARPPTGVHSQVQLVIAVFTATVVLWITRPVPYTVSSILCVILLFGLGLVDSFQEAVTGMASSLVFFFILLYLIGSSIEKVDLDDQVARRLVSPKSTPRTTIRRLSAALLLIALIMPSGVARTVTFIPIVNQISSLYGLAADSSFRRFAQYLLGHVNTVGSLAVMTGGGSAVVTAELINSMVRPFTWIEWAFYMVPPVVVIYVLTIGTVGRLFHVDDSIRLDENKSGSTGLAPESFTAVDPMTRDQMIVIATLLLAIVFWIVGSFIGIPAIIPAMFVVMVYSLPGVDVITTAEIREVNWGVVFLMGTMLSLLEVMQDLNALDLIIESMLVIVPADGPNLLAFGLVIGIALLVRGTISAPSVSMIILFPIVLEFAITFGYAPLFTALGLMLLIMSTVFLPINTPTVLIAYENGPLSGTEVLALGIMTSAFAVVVVVACWVFYWPILDNMLTGVF